MTALTRAITNRTKQTRRGFSFPACDSIYRYRVSYNIGGEMYFFGGELFSNHSMK